MATGVDLKTILAQACALMQEALELSNKLVMEVEAEHYWTTYSLDSLSQLKSITHNLAKRLETTEPLWGDPKALFAAEEGQKLWRSAVGLLRALPPVRDHAPGDRGSRGTGSRGPEGRGDKVPQ